MIEPVLVGKLQELCRRTFPERSDQRISQIERLAARRHSMIGLSLSWQEGRRLRIERLMLRRYADEWTWWSSPDRYKAQREWTVMRWLYAQGMPVPNLYAVDQEDSGAFLLVARVPGHKMGPVPNSPRKDEGWIAMQPYVDALAVLLVQLHERTPPASVRELLPAITLADELVRLKEFARRSSNIELTEAIEDLSRRQVEVRHPCVLHGDPQLGNVLCDAQGITALFDWENAALGDPRWDVARVANSLHSFQAYSLVERLYDVYAERSGRALSDMPVWETVAAVQQWAVTAWVEQSAWPSSAWSEATREQARRALTRLCYGQGEPSEPGAQLAGNSEEAETSAKSEPETTGDRNPEI